eukprot:GHRR01025032.1.p1 GENE.GHRR01025032.1~~GHRR01025032.1.p1  ORF type:complete len:219 (+),score=98.76 GHRR01025032.1:374-1030(+)
MSVLLQASAEQQGHASRRQMLNTGILLTTVTALQPQAAYAGLERYVKKKKLDPLDTYVPLVLEAKDRLAELQSVMAESPTTARQMLRSGPFSGLRDNIRALGQYAADPAANGGSGIPEKDATQLVSNFFRALENYDLTLYNVVRTAKQQKKKGDDEAKADLDAAAALDQQAAAQQLQAAVQQLDKLIATVPRDVLDKSRQVLERVHSKQAAAAASSAV